MRCFAVAVLSCLVLTTFLLAAGKTRSKDADEVKVPDNARQATARALAWLAKQQNSDRSWSEARYPHNPAITSFALKSENPFLMGLANRVESKANATGAVRRRSRSAHCARR